MRGQPSLATNAAEAGEQMLSLAMGMWSWGWQITSCVSLCPRDAVTLLIPCQVRPHLTGGSCGCRYRHCGTPCLSVPQPSTTRCLWRVLAADLPQREGQLPYVTCAVSPKSWKSFPELHSLTLNCSPTDGGEEVGRPRGGHPLTHPQESPGCEKADPGS